MEPPWELYSLSYLPPGEASEILVLLHHSYPPPPLLPSLSSSLPLGTPPPQESQLSLGGQRCMGEPDEELASAFPVFIRNAVLGQKQPKRAKAEPRRSTDAVSMASHKWQMPALWGGGRGTVGGQLPSFLTWPTHFFLPP